MCNDKPSTTPLHRLNSRSNSNDVVVEGTPTTKPRKWRFRSMSDPTDEVKTRSNSIDDVAVPLKDQAKQPAQGYNSSMERFDTIGGLPWEPPQILRSPHRSPHRHMPRNFSSGCDDSNSTAAYGNNSVCSSINNDLSASINWVELDQPERDQEPYRVKEQTLGSVMGDMIPQGQHSMSNDGSSQTSFSASNSSLPTTNVRDIDVLQRRARRKDGTLPPKPHTSKPFRRPPRPAPTAFDNSMNCSLNLCDVFGSGNNNSGDLTEEEEAVRSAQEEELLLLAMNRSVRETSIRSTAEYCGYVEDTAEAVESYDTWNDTEHNCDDALLSHEEELVKLAIENSLQDSGGPTLDRAAFVATATPVHSFVAATAAPYSPVRRSGTNGRYTYRPPNHSLAQGQGPAHTEEVMIRLAMDLSLQTAKKPRPILVSPSRSPNRRSHVHQYCSTASPSTSMAELEVTLRSEQEALEYALERSLEEYKVQQS